MNMKSLCLFLCISFSCILQVFAKKAQYTIPTDTLVFCLTIPDAYDAATRNKVVAAMDSLVAHYNRNDRALKFRYVKLPTEEAVALSCGAPQLAPEKRSYWITGVNVLLLGANVLLFPYFAPIIPFYFIPIAKCDLNIREELDWLVIENEQTVHCSAYFRSADKQYKKLAAALVEDIDTNMRQWQRQYERYMKRQAKRAQQ